MITLEDLIKAKKIIENMYPQDKCVVCGDKLKLESHFLPNTFCCKSKICKRVWLCLTSEERKNVSICKKYAWEEINREIRDYDKPIDFMSYTILEDGTVVHQFEDFDRMEDGTVIYDKFIEFTESFSPPGKDKIKNLLEELRLKDRLLGKINQIESVLSKGYECCKSAKFKFEIRKTKLI